MVQYFGALYASAQSRRVQKVLDYVPTRLTSEDNLELLKPNSEDQIKQVVFRIPTSKSPGPKGFTGGFFQDHWDVIRDDLIKVVRAFWHLGKMLRKMNHALMTLIPKIKSPRQVQQYKPISLCNVPYKVIAKIITNIL